MSLGGFATNFHARCQFGSPSFHDVYRFVWAPECGSNRILLMGMTSWNTQVRHATFAGRGISTMRNRIEIHEHHPQSQSLSVLSRLPWFQLVGCSLFWWPPSILSFVQGGVLEAKGLRHWRVQLDGGATEGLNQNLIFVKQFSGALSTPQRILRQRNQKLMEVEVPWLRVIVGDSTRLVPWSKCSPNKFGRLTALSFKKNRRISASTAARPLTSFRFK